jgi:hypothetical protein
MLNKIRFNNPILRYRLDPGEPGIPYPSKASMSVARVAGHEVGNIMRFRRKAAREGGIVVDTKIYINRKQVGPYLAATSGYSEARIIYPHRRKNIETEKIPSDIYYKVNKEHFENIEPENSTVSVPSENPDNRNENPVIHDDLDVRIKDLEQEERLLASDLMYISQKYNTDSGSADTEEYMKQQEVKKIKHEIAYLKMKQTYQKQNQLLSGYFSGLYAAAKLNDSIYGRNSHVGNLINIVV